MAGGGAAVGAAGAATSALGLFCFLLLDDGFPAVLMFVALGVEVDVEMEVGVGVLLLDGVSAQAMGELAGI